MVCFSNTDVVSSAGFGGGSINYELPMEKHQNKKRNLL